MGILSRPFTEAAAQRFAELLTGTLSGPPGPTGPALVLGTYLGVWNASTNSPALSAGGSGVAAGNYHIVTTAGSTSLDGNSTWAVGDLVKKGASTWERIPFSGLSLVFAILTIGAKRRLVADSADRPLVMQDLYGEVLMEILDTGLISIADLHAMAAEITAATVSTLTTGSIRRVATANAVAAHIVQDRWGEVFYEVPWDGVPEIATADDDDAAGGAAAAGYSAAEIDVLNAWALARSAEVRGTLLNELQRTIADYCHFFFTGQSFSTDSEGWPALSKVARAHGAFMIGQSVHATSVTSETWTQIGTAALTPAAANVVAGGAVLSDGDVAALAPGSTALGSDGPVNAINAFRSQHNRARFSTNDPLCRPIISSIGTGARSLAELTKGASPNLFNRNPSCATLAKGLVQAIPATYGVGGAVVLHGQADYALGTTLAAFKAGWKTWGKDFDADVNVAIGGGTGKVPKFFLPADHGWTQDGLAIGEAVRQLCVEERDWFLPAPCYWVTDKGGHLDANGYAWLGHMLAKVMNRVITLGQDWQPLQPIKLIKRGSGGATEILVAYNMPEGGSLVFDTPWNGHVRATDWDDKGCALTDAGGFVPLSSVEIVADAVLRIRPARSIIPLAGTDKLYFSYAGKTGFNGQGCLRDNAPGVADENYRYGTGAGHYLSADIADLKDKPYPLWNPAVPCHMAVKIED